jgi:hypothetical protein
MSVPSSAVHFPWPEIGSLRTAIANVKDRVQITGVDDAGKAVRDVSLPLPVLHYSGTAKLHGTNAAIGIQRSSGLVWFQSRERVLTEQADNNGFRRTFLDYQKKGFDFRSLIPSGLSPAAGDTFVLYGEWCGGNIQKNVALSQLPKQFVVFGCCSNVNISSDEKQCDAADSSSVRLYHYPPSQICSIPEFPEFSIYNIYSIPSYNFEVDFSDPAKVQSALKAQCDEIERVCPWGKRFGIEGVGEGFVCRATDSGWEGEQFWFKVKGESHSVTKASHVAPVDIEKADSISDFVSRVVTPARCDQSISKLKESGVERITRAHIGQYMKWIVNDIIKEESDTAKASGIDIAKIAGQINTAARRWFMDNEINF